MRTSLREMHKQLQEHIPEEFERLLARGSIWPEELLGQVQQENADDLHGRMMEWNDAHHLPIYPEYASAATAELERDILDALNNVTGMRSDSRVSVDPLKELASVGDSLYTRRAREEECATKEQDIEFLVAESFRYCGNRFMAVDIGGHHMFVKYYPEELALRAPEGANAVLSGNAFLVTVKHGFARSPVVPDHLIGPVDLEDDMYHVLPLEFYKVRVDTSKRFESKPFDVTGEDLPAGTRVAVVTGPEGVKMYETRAVLAE